MKKVFVGILGFLTFWACASCAPHPTSVVSSHPIGFPENLPGLPEFAKVSEDLYRGGQPTTEGFARLKAIGIKTIVDLRGKSHHDLLDGLGLKSVQIPSSAARPDAQEVIQFLRLTRDRAACPIFIHDDRGSDRVGCYVGAYRIVEQRWTARDAELELPRFGFDPFWHAIPEFLRNIDPARTREELLHPSTTQPIKSRGFDDTDAND